MLGKKGALEQKVNLLMQIPIANEKNKEMQTEAYCHNALFCACDSVESGDNETNDEIE